MKSIQMKRNLVLIGALLALATSALLAGLVSAQDSGSSSSSSSSSLFSYLDQARNLLGTGMEARESAKSLSSLMPNENPQTMAMLRESINKATDLINNYRQNGLSNLPAMPNLPGLNTIMRVPDKLLRAELSMLQDEIRMAQEMMQNPISATMSAPRDLASMFSRMAEQLEQ